MRDHMRLNRPQIESDYEPMPAAVSRHPQPRGRLGSGRVTWVVSASALVLAVLLGVVSYRMANGNLAQEGRERVAEADNPAVLVIDIAEADVSVTGDRMGVKVEACVQNGSAFPLEDADVPSIQCGETVIAGRIAEGDGLMSKSIGSGYSRGTIVWEGDIPAGESGFAVCEDDSHIVYYSDRLISAANGKLALAE